MSEGPAMHAYIIALNFQDGPLTLSAQIAPDPVAATAIAVVTLLQDNKITQPLMGVSVMELTTEFLDAARTGGKPATVLSLVPQHPSPTPPPAAESAPWTPTPEWRECTVVVPPKNDIIEIMRREWKTPTTTRWGDIHPQMNVADLYWRPVMPIDPPPAA